MCIDHALVVELVQDAHMVLGLVHVDAYVIMVALEVLELAQELLLVVFEEVLLVLHLLHLSS